LTGLKPGDCFSTPDKAAIDALKWIYEESLYLGKEMGGGIYQRGFGDISKYDVNESITFKIWQIKIGFPDAFYKKNVLSYNNEAVYDK
jgi:hypothetical protein